MEELELVTPGERHRAMALELKSAFFRRGETIINGSALLDQLEFEDWLENTRQNSDPATARTDWVVAGTFFAVRRADGKAVGIVDVRHSLENEFLRQYGGHIGYAVVPGERQKGYGGAILRLALEYATRLGLERVMLGCYADNAASRNTILKCDGVLTEEKSYVDGRAMQVFWISL